MGGLRRDLGFWEMAAVAASMMLGSGIFFGPQLTAAEFPRSDVVLILWGIGGVVALAGAWTFGRLASLLPYAGGPYVYLRDAYGSLPAFLFAWTSLVVIAPTSLAVLADIFARQLAAVQPLSPTGILLLSFWSLGAMAFVNAIGVKTGGRVQGVLTGLKVLLVAGLIALLFLPSNPGPAPDPVPAGGRLSVAFVGILFAVGGWEYAVLASEEVRDGRRTIPRALLAGTAVVVLLYLLLVAGFLDALGPAGVAASSALAPEAADAVLPGASVAVALAVAVSALGTVNAITLLGPRATFALARDRLIPARLAHLSRRWGTPVAALVVQLVLAAVYRATGAFQTVAAYTVIGTGAFIVPAALALPLLHKRAVGTSLPIRDGVVAFTVAATYCWFLVYSFIEDTRTALVGWALILLGFVPYILFRALGYKLPRPNAG